MWYGSNDIGEVESKSGKIEIKIVVVLVVVASLEVKQVVPESPALTYGLHLLHRVWHR